MIAQLSLDTEYWKRVDALLVIALGLPRERRQAWLDSLTDEDQALRQVIAKLLARTDAETDAFMCKPVRLGESDERTESQIEDAAEDLVGPYRLISLIGSGGMGAVWLAEPLEGPMMRKVALKLPRSDWSPGLADRLKRECTALSRLEHPNIARLYDAGLLDNGRPYLAMEYIQGAPIDRYCREKVLGIPAILHLFLLITDAITYAHARLVVHRDLKPSNILVDGNGVVHVVDFGLAKLLDQSSNENPAITRQGSRAFTPSYASPEQVTGSDISVGSDVYSLGVVLFELLTGKRPYELKRESIASLEEAILTADAVQASNVTGLTPAVARTLRGDIDNILAKALSKKVQDRYTTIEAFAADIRLHLAGKPVSAHAKSLSYRAGKFIRRNRIALGAAALIACVGVAGVAGVVHQAQRADSEARRATLERDKALQELQFSEAAEELNRFLLSEHSARKVSPADTLKRGEKLVNTQFSGNPRLHARMLGVLADLQGEVMDFKQAEQLLLKAADLSHGLSDPGLSARLNCTLAGAYGASARRAEAKRIFETELPKIESRPADFSDALMVCYVQRGTFLRNGGDMAGALLDYQNASLILNKTKPGLRFDKVHVQNSVASALSGMGRLDEAIPIYEQGMADIAQMGRSETTGGLIMLNNYLNALTRAGLHSKAQQAFLQIDRSLAVQGGPYDTLQINFARVLADLGFHQQAIDAVEPAIAAKAALGDSRGEAFGALVRAFANCSLANSSCAGQVAALSSKAKSIFPPGHSFFAIIKMLQGQELLLRRRDREAAQLLEAATKDFLAAPERNVSVVRALTFLAIAQQRLGDHESATRSAGRAVELAREFTKGFDSNYWIGIALLGQVEVALAQGNRAAALAAADGAQAILMAHAGESAPLAQRAALLTRQLRAHLN